MDEVELGEYVADYAYHERDLEGNYEPVIDPISRVPVPNRGSKRASPNSTPEIHTTVTDLDSQQTIPSHDSTTRARSRSRDRRIRMSTDDEVEMVDVDLAALQRAESKIEWEKAEARRKAETTKDR